VVGCLSAMKTVRLIEWVIMAVLCQQSVYGDDLKTTIVTRIFSSKFKHRKPYSLDFWFGGMEVLP